MCSLANILGMLGSACVRWSALSDLGLNTAQRQGQKGERDLWLSSVRDKGGGQIPQHVQIQSEGPSQLQAMCT